MVCIHSKIIKYCLEYPFNNFHFNTTQGNHKCNTVQGIPVTLARKQETNLLHVWIHVSSKGAGFEPTA